MRKIKIIAIILTIGLLLITSCQVKVAKTGEEEAQRLKRKSLNISKITKWSNSAANQVQEYDREGRMIREQWYNLNNFLVTQRVLTYDLKYGNHVKTVWYKNKDILKSSNHFTYDRRGLMKEEIWYTADDELRSRSVYEYDKEGKLISASRYDNKGELFGSQAYNYTNGLLTEFIDKDRSGNVLNRHVYKYSEEKLKTEEEWRDRMGRLNTVRQYRYDENGLLVEELEFRRGEYQHKIVRDYDGKGLLLHEKWIGADDTPFFESEYIYEYFDKEV
jgi:hypothetical protein